MTFNLLEIQNNSVNVGFGLLDIQKEGEFARSFLGFYYDKEDHVFSIEFLWKTYDLGGK